MRPIRILLVDDHPFVREGIRSSLQAQEQFEVVGEAGSGQEALEQAARLRPDVISMDIHMPVMSGLEAARQLRDLVPESKVLIMSFHDGRDVLSQVVEAGACGYISKSEPASELARAIVTLHQGGTFFSAGFRDLLESRPSEAGAPQLRMARRLSTREREVLVLLADGMTNKQTAAILDLSVRTIEKHRERIMEKLKLHNMVELTKYAIANELVAVP